MLRNPWLVENVKEFSFLNCPECKFKSKQENMFEYHAVKNHPLSFVLFDNKDLSIVKEISRNVDPLDGFSPEKERTLEELMFAEPELPEPNNKDESSLIAEALINSSNGYLAFTNICKAINAKHPEYKLEDLSWQESIHHNLPANKNFVITKKNHWKLAEDHSISLPNNENDITTKKQKLKMFEDENGFKGRNRYFPFSITGCFIVKWTK